MASERIKRRIDRLLEVESSGEFRFRDGREMELKGLAGTHQVFEVNLP